MNRKILMLLITLMLTGCGMSAEQEKIPENTEAKVEMEEETNMSGYRFEDFSNVEITFTSVLNANAYGARGTFRMSGTHHYEKRNGEWIAVNR